MKDLMYPICFYVIFDVFRSLLSLTFCLYNPLLSVYIYDRSLPFFLPPQQPWQRVPIEHPRHDQHGHETKR